MNPKKDTSHHPAFAAQREYFSDDYGAPACMNKRMYAAIKLRVPDSGEKWLDDMIRQSLRDEFATAALQRDLASGYEAKSIVALADWYYKAADAMLKARDTAPSTE